jgi:hypothetical protein
LKVFTMSPIRCLGCVRSIQKGGLPPLDSDQRQPARQLFAQTILHSCKSIAALVYNTAGSNLPTLLHAF